MTSYDVIRSISSLRNDAGITCHTLLLERNGRHFSIDITKYISPSHQTLASKMRHRASASYISFLHNIFQITWFVAQAMMSVSLTK